MTDEMCIKGAGLCVILAVVITAVVFMLTGGYSGYGTGKR